MYLPRKSKETEFRRTDLVYHWLKHRLATGELAQGSRLDVNELVEEMGSSRQPVSTAISKLANEGFLRVIPQVGCFVVTVEPRQIEDFFRLFALTEGLACELAAMRRVSNGVATLRAVLNQKTHLLETERDPTRFSEQISLLNRDFHGHVHEMAESEFIGNLADSLWDRRDFYLAGLNLQVSIERAKASEVEYEKIVTAIEGGDSAEAKNLMAALIGSLGDEAIASGQKKS